jgi:hypothetical protein
MGDMADYYLDSQQDDWEHDSEVTCKYCGKTGLYWWDMGRGFRLIDPETDTVHTCREYSEYWAARLRRDRT